MSNEVKPITIKMINKQNMPLILNNKIIWKKKLLPYDGSVKVVKPLIQEDLIFDSKSNGDFTCGDVRELTIVNRLNKTTNTCRTLARCKSESGVVFEKTSDEITKLIGQNNYDTLFSTLCSVINQELKIRAIYSLLTVPKAASAVACQTNVLKNISNSVESVTCAHMLCQTDESYISTYKKKIKMRMRSKRSQLAPYVIPEAPEAKKVKRVVIEPEKFGTLLKSTESFKDNESHKGQIPDLGQSPIFEHDSNSNDSNYSKLSINTTSELMLNPLSMLDKVIEPMPQINNKEKDYKLHNLDSPKDTIYPNGKPLPFDQKLRSIPQAERTKVLLKQAISDWQNCLKQDESGHLPIHVAVLNNDLDLLKRQCLVLKMRNYPVDIPADNLTPLRMSLYQDDVSMTALLLQYNADPLDSDFHDQTCFHVAAEKASEHLQALVNHCQHNARKVLEENEDIWKPEYATKTDEELAKILMSHISKLYDTNGYTPLMLASKAGRYENIKLLVEACPESVNTRMTNSGNTPLFLAVSSACMDSTDRGNKSKVVDHFRKSIEILVDHGADPNLNNFNGNNVNDLLQDYNIGDLSMLVANKLTSRNISMGQVPSNTSNFENVMLVKGKDGKVDVKKIEKTNKKSPKSTKVTKKSPAAQKTVYPKTSPKTSLIIKSETITGKTVTSPVTTVIPDNMTVQNFRLDKPLILKTVISQNKRKIEMTVGPSNKNSNTND